MAATPIRTPGLIVLPLPCASVLRPSHLKAAPGDEALTSPSDPNSRDNAVNRIQQLHLRILVVDDEDQFRESVVHMLRSVYESFVDEAAATSVAFNKVSHGRRFDLILMDVAMPQVSGIEACQKMQALGISSLIVLMSAHSENLAAAQSLGVPFLEKPLRWEALEKILLNCGGDA